jgi:protein SCO1/2
MQKSLQMTSLKKWTAIILIDAIIIGLAICLFGIIRHFYHADIKIQGIYLKTPREMPDISLIDQHGHAFGKAQLKGHWTLMFFGFTYCPMICPATFDTLNKMVVQLQNELPADQLPQVVFISVDPERDTIARLNQYVGAYNSHFIGARTDGMDIKNFAKQLSISSTSIAAHNTDILLINPQGKIQAYFLYPHRAKNLADDYVKILQINSHSRE